MYTEQTGEIIRTFDSLIDQLKEVQHLSYPNKFELRVYFENYLRGELERLGVVESSSLVSGYIPGAAA